MDPEDIVEGASVALATDSTQIGVVLKRQGKRVRIDFSGTGGKASAWVVA
eukprot:COSAG06_NODE_4089_length_4586_cov_52.994874_2_plen_49_part_01